MISLPPTAVEPQNAMARRVIINEKNFVKSASLRIKDKVQDHPNNLHTDKSNDVYVTDIAVALTVKPSTENGDSLVLKIEDIQKRPFSVTSVHCFVETTGSPGHAYPPRMALYTFTGSVPALAASTKDATGLPNKNLL